MSGPLKYVDPKEFRALGYLQEVNRQFFHPLGMALEIVVDDVTKEETIGGIWDCRDDPDGIIFAGELLPTEARREAVHAELRKHMVARLKKMGDVIQPIGYVPELKDGKWVR